MAWHLQALAVGVGSAAAAVVLDWLLTRRARPKRGQRRG